MRDAEYYRQPAARARRLMQDILLRREIAEQLASTARDYDEIAVDLE